MTTHETAIVEGDNNQLGEGSLIGPFVKVRNVKLGKNAKLMGFCNVYECEIGDESKVAFGVEIQSGVKIGKNSSVQSHTFLCSMVTLGDNVFLGHGVMTINDKFPPSRKRTGSERHWRPTKIGNNVMVGTGVTLYPVTIGDGAWIAAGSVVTKDVPAGEVWAGSPAKRIKHVDEMRYEDGSLVFA